MAGSGAFRVGRSGTAAGSGGAAAERGASTGAGGGVGGAAAGKDGTDGERATVGPLGSSAMGDRDGRLIYAARPPPATSSVATAPMTAPSRSERRGAAT